MKLDIKNIPSEIKELLDNNVNFREIEDALTAYQRLRQVEVFASNKGVANFVEIDWNYFYSYYESTEDDFHTAKQLDEKYGIMNLIELQDEYNESL
jgi:predicted helicase